MEQSTKATTISQNLLDDLTVRFILNNEEFVNLNPEEYFFILEQAHWYALDFYKIKQIPLSEFAEQILAHNSICLDVMSDYLKFKAYKQTIKVFGTILFSPKLTHVLLVEQINTCNNFTFPKGKKSKNETGVQCAIRETLEEVGYDASDKIVDIPVTVFDKMTFYCVFNVKMDYPFKTRTRNEIAKIFWFDLRRLNDIKEKKKYRIFYHAYKAIESRVIEIKKSLFSFDQTRINNAMDSVLND